MLAGQKILYTEEFPDKLSLSFDTIEGYNDFKKKRLEEVSQKLSLFTYTSKYVYTDWKHNSVTLNKDGTPRKYFNPVHLQTNESRKKQELKFSEYLDRKKAESKLRSEQKHRLDQEAYDKAIKVLLDNKIDLNRLDIRVKK